MKLFERFELKKEALDIMEKQEIFDILTQIDRVFLKYEDDFITNNDWLDIQKLLGLNSKIILNPLIDYMNIYKAMSFVFFKKSSQNLFYRKIKTTTNYSYFKRIKFLFNSTFKSNKFQTFIS